MSEWYKVVRPNLGSFADSSFKYRIGKARLAPKVTDQRRLCENGLLHASPTPAMAARYGTWPYRLLLVEGEPVQSQEDKGGFLRLQVAKELPVSMCWGASGHLVERVVKRAEKLTYEEAGQLDAVRDAAWAAARAAAAWDAARAAAWGAAARAAAVGAAVSDLVGQYGLEQKHIDKLLEPWRKALGHDPLADDEVWRP